MSRIFISYSRADETFARQLATELDRLGADVWIDVDDIPVGVKWSKAIQSGLDTADVMLVIISPESMGSSNVEDEWQYYLDQKKAVIPILHEPAKIHFQLNRIQYIDFHNQEFGRALRKLHTELAVQGVNLKPLPPLSAPAQTPLVPPVSTSPVFSQSMSAMPSRAVANMLPIYAGLGIIVLIILMVGGLLLSGVLGGNDEGLTDDPVQNSENLLNAMSDRNFGDAEELVCDQVDIQESAFWDEPLNDITCQQDGDDQVACSFTLRGEQQHIFFLIDSEERICGQAE